MYMYVTPAARSHIAFLACFSLRESITSHFGLFWVSHWFISSFYTLEDHGWTIWQQSEQLREERDRENEREERDREWEWERKREKGNITLNWSRIHYFIVWSTGRVSNNGCNILICYNWKITWVSSNILLFGQLWLMHFSVVFWTIIWPTVAIFIFVQSKLNLWKSGVVAVCKCRNKCKILFFTVN